MTQQLATRSSCTKRLHETHAGLYGRLHRFLDSVFPSTRGARPGPRGAPRKPRARVEEAEAPRQPRKPEKKQVGAERQTERSAGRGAEEARGTRSQKPREGPGSQKARLQKG